MEEMTASPDGGIRLAPKRYRQARPDLMMMETLEYDIMTGDVRVGCCELRLGRGKRTHLTGHISYTVYPEHRGRGYAALALKALRNIASRCGQAELLITMKPDNVASRKTCESAGAVYSGTVDVPADDPLAASGCTRLLCYRF